MVASVKRLMYTGVILGMFVVPVVTAAPAAAHGPTITADRAGADLVLVQQGDVVTEDLYAAGNRVVIEGLVEGDVLVAATGEVLISGTVQGSVTGVASSVRITGEVDGSVRVAAASVEVSGTVGEDVFVGASTAAVTGSVGRDLLVWAPTLDLAGTVGRDVVGQVFETARIGGVIDGDVDMTVGGLVVESGAQVGGTLGYRSAKPADISDGVTVGRQIVHREPIRPNVRVTAIILLTEVVTVLSVILFGFLLFWLIPGTLAKAAEAVRSVPGRSAFIGVLAAFLPVLVLGGAAALTVASSPELALPVLVVGGPIGVLILGVLGVGSLLAPVPVLIVVGRRIVGGKRSPQAAFAVGAILWVLALLIPVVRIIVAVAIGAIGLGAWLIAVFSTRTVEVWESAAPAEPRVAPAYDGPTDHFPLPPE